MAPLMMRSAKIARNSDSVMPLTATRIEKKAVVLNDARQPGSWNRSRKLSKPTHSFENPKESCIWNDCTRAWPAGQKKKTLMMASWGARSTHGSHAERNKTRFSMSKLSKRKPRRPGNQGGGGGGGLSMPPGSAAGRYRQMFGSVYLLARAKRASCSLPRVTAVSSASLGDFLPDQICSVSSSMMERICTKLPRRMPRDLSVAFLIICVTATSVPGFLV